MEKKSNEVEKFFSDLPTNDDKEADIFGDKKEAPKEPAAGSGNEPKVPVKGEAEGDENEPRKNRRHRRLEEQLQAERQSNIALNERLMKVIERQESPLSQSSPSEVPPEWIALYGDTPEAQKAWKVQDRMLQSVKTQAKEEAIKEIEEKQTRAKSEQRQFESFIDGQLESLEDAYDVDLTSDSPAARKSRRELLEMVSKLSPKDEDGNITGYADFGSTFELYKSRAAEPKQDETVNKAKEIAGRSMQQSGQGAVGTAPKITPGFRGWQTDYNL